MSTLDLIIIGAIVTAAIWGAIEYWAWKTGRKLITWHVRRFPKLIVFFLGLGVGLLAAHFWWCPAPCVS